MKLVAGEKVFCGDRLCIIKSIQGCNNVLIEELATSKFETVGFEELKPTITSDSNNEIQILSEKQKLQAELRLSYLEPILNKKRTKAEVQEVANKLGKGLSTTYRYLKKFEETGLLSSLADEDRTGGKGKGRITHELETIIIEKINKIFLKRGRSKKSINDTIIEVRIECAKRGINAPSEGTIRDRIGKIDKRERTRKRDGVKADRDKYEAIKGHFPDADHPLDVVQIDHTPLDIILVDDKYRNHYKRPYLTMAIDVNTRLVLGFYISFDPPSYLSVGICISRCLLPKEKWLLQIGVEAEWPSWGPMKILHLDNAREFKSSKLKAICIEYGIRIVHRPPYFPHYGGHIERVFKTFSKPIHSLPGSTFSNPEERGEYDSEKNAALTLSEFEKWLTIGITKDYHQKIHSEINTTPLDKYWTGLVGDEETVGIGLPIRYTNERKVKLDFLPSTKRTVQRVGVKWDHIEYFSDVLRPYIRSGKKLIFKRDPRDISIIYFYDPKYKDYLPVPYRNVGYPAISLWEHKEIVRKIKEKGKKKVNQKKIFEAYEERKKIEEDAVRKTRKVQKQSIHKEVTLINDPDFSKNDYKDDEKIDFDNLNFEAYDTTDFDSLRR